MSSVYVTDTTAADQPTTSPPADHGNDSFDSLYPAIVQCFSIILLGYVCGRAGVMSRTQGDGLSRFVSTFALPALVFHSLCSLDFSSVNWEFLSALLVAKAAVFLLVATVTLLVRRPLDVGTAGMFAIFATQSNDFAVGYPLIKAIYSETHPEFIQYIYLAAPVSLCILNPIGFIMMEIQLRRTISSEERGRKSRCSLVWSVVKGMITNPIIAMSVVGLIANFVFEHNLPAVIDQPIKTLGDAFAASALFYLGFSLVGKVQGQMGSSLLVSLLLIFAKLIVLPFFTIESVSLLQPAVRGNSSHTASGGDNHLSSDTIDAYKLFGFLYGTFPTAPSVLFYAAQYGFASDIIASSMVLCTVLSAPLMFVSAMMVSMTFYNLDYLAVVRDTAFDIAILTIISGLGVLVVFVTSKKIRRIPHQLTACMAVCQILLAVGMVTEAYTVPSNPESSEDYTAGQYVVLSVHLVGVYGSRIFSALIAVQLYMITKRSLCFALKTNTKLMLIGFCLPVLIVSLMLIIGSIVRDQPSSQAYLGRAQIVTSSVVLVLSCAVIVIVLVLRQRHTLTAAIAKTRQRRPSMSRRPLLEERESENEEEELLSSNQSRINDANEDDNEDDKDVMSGNTDVLGVKHDGSRTGSIHSQPICSTCKRGDCSCSFRSQPAARYGSIDTTLPIDSYGESLLQTHGCKSTVLRKDSTDGNRPNGRLEELSTDECTKSACDDPCVGAAFSSSSLEHFTPPVGREFNIEDVIKWPGNGGALAAAHKMTQVSVGKPATCDDSQATQSCSRITELCSGRKSRQQRNGNYGNHRRHPEKAFTGSRQAEKVVSSGGTEDRVVSPGSTEGRDVCTSDNNCNPVAKLNTQRRIEEGVASPGANDSLNRRGENNDDVGEHMCLLSDRRCGVERRRVCVESLGSYRKTAGTLPEDTPDMEEEGGAPPSPPMPDPQIMKHVALLVCLALSMVCGSFTVIWQLMNSDDFSSIYVELLFIDNVLNMGQGLFTFAFFGLDHDLIVIPVMRRLRRLVYGSDAVILPPVYELSADVRLTCNKFCSHHLDHCRSDISKTLRLGLWTYQDAFRGADLCGWLIKVGLAADESEAEQYGQRLLLGRVISHIRNIHYFHGNTLVYKYNTDSKSVY